MLIHLDIENYALIDHLDITFHRGFTAITGETGAGKSILINALDLILGKRADNQFLLDPDRKCIVEATFSIAEYNLSLFFEAAGLDYDDHTIVRREVQPNGKSRAFINDTPVTLNQLRELGGLLLDVHAQHATTSLQDHGFQLSVIDTYAGLENKRSNYQQQFVDLNNKREALKEYIEQENNAKSTLDYKTFLLDELLAADLNAEEQELLEKKLSLLTHSEEIKGALYQAQSMLYDEEPGILNLLTQVESKLNNISPYHPGIELLVERIKSDLIDLSDINVELARLNDSIEYNHEQLLIVQQRLELLYKLQHKHLVNSNQELIQIIEKLEVELGEYSSLEHRIKDLEANIQTSESVLKKSAEKLSGSRKKVFPTLEKEIVASLVHMGIPEARFEIKHELSSDYLMEGCDRIEFYFNANEGHSLKPLAEIASGGELSRVMLSIKSIISRKKLLPTIIFDEIDNGLSGDIAGRVGDVLFSAASRMQVIAVTHLPQIAGKASHHYSVFKQSKNNITFSNIKFLDQKERVAELAKMIGGREVTEASVAAAKELLTSTLETR